jgi:putative molybdopterin biosynthesis protein
MAEQRQFLEVINRDEAEERFHLALDLQPLGIELIPLEQALGRILARDVHSAHNIPSFDRSNYDGYAVKAINTHGATEETPCSLVLLDETIATAVVPQTEVTSGCAMSIATGGMLPRGADAIVMIEHTDVVDGALVVRKTVNAGFGISFAGSDITAGEIVLRQGDLLTSRETGVLAAIGESQVLVYLKPKVGIVSTGDEIIPPGELMQPAMVFDSNARILSDAVTELGGSPVILGIVQDDEQQLQDLLSQAIRDCDVILLSGGTSKGEGDISYKVVEKLNDPGIVAHGVALKPGKPICLAVTQQKPVVILPGFPTSAIFTFHEFVAPVIRQLAGNTPVDTTQLDAKMAVRVRSEIGRTEYLLVGLVQRPDDNSLVAYPMGKGSGSVTTFSHADGFITIDRHHEILDEDSPVSVTLLGKELVIADLVVIGSHCVGLDLILSTLQQSGTHSKLMTVGSTGGVEAARRGECDIAGVHLLNVAGTSYNEHLLDDSLELIKGYKRTQGIIFRQGDSRFKGKTVEEIIQLVMMDPSIHMVNRNRGSGTRILIDQLFCQPGTKPTGYSMQSKSHHAVAASIEHGSADWGVAIKGVLSPALDFIPLANEEFDFIIPAKRRDKTAVTRFLNTLSNAAIREKLIELGFELHERE